MDGRNNNLGVTLVKHLSKEILLFNNIREKYLRT